jgi:hypothetical protein
MYKERSLCQSGLKLVAHAAAVPPRSVKLRTAHNATASHTHSMDSLQAPSRSPRSWGQPYALVWSPIPVLSWLVPFLGHLGLCSSSGLTYDFAGPFTVNEGQLLFGKPTR